MDWFFLEKHFSISRMHRYLQSRGGDTEKAAMDYSSNILLSEAMVPMLNTLEIALRNGIHYRLSHLYGRDDWWEAWQGDSKFHWQSKQVKQAKGKLRRNNEPQTSEKVLAELTFGFWVSLFNAPFQMDLWKDLRLVFSGCPRGLRKRRNISSRLNQIRDLRNRIFHYEPLLWISPKLIDQHASGVELIKWVDPLLEQWLEKHDRVLVTWSERTSYG